MSGHSHWKQIQGKKGTTDIKRGQIFSKLLSAVSITARENPNPDFNPRLRAAIDKAKENHVPSENIERAIKKSSDAKNLEEIVVEAYGPEKAAIIIEGITDNKNRSINEIRTLLSESGAKMADQGSVLWAFEKTPAGWQAKFRQSISDAGKQNLQKLVLRLEEHNDVQKVTTNAE